MMPGRLPDHDPRLDATVNIPRSVEVDDIRDRFVRDWQSQQQPQIEEYLSSVSAEGRNVLLLELLREELVLRRESGEPLAVEYYLSRFPKDRDTVELAFATIDEHPAIEATDSPEHSSGEQTLDGTVVGASSGGIAAQGALRYRKVRELGKGAFGTVWLAEDVELCRLVALKEPRDNGLRTAADVESWLSEARVLASLDHPYIVPVYDFGRTPEGSCYLVSKLIDGKDLGTYVKQKPMSFSQAAELVASVADALQQTHRRGLVHRDLKPGNILVDVQGRPYVTDFGLALRDEDLGKDQGMAGTPAYMSPEQARGEGHLVDGRSDIFSLGVVLYELLTGTKPFSGANWGTILVQITTMEARPLRQRNEAIPRELERICLKALSKRAADRFSCAADFAEDLRHWLVESTAPALSAHSSQPPSESIRIVPKSLRSFDAGDSDFFLELLPGPRDRYGLPEVIRFWKTRIEETDPDRTFRVGLIYGPSGCGKSSLMKAGLLPRLADHVVRIFLEATPDQTEQSLLHALHRVCADLPKGASLADTLAEIRRDKGRLAGRKLVLVIDQFEQWLHAHGADRNSLLVAALRQCDGQRIQAILLVRDDFWMSISAFLQSLEVRLIDGENATAVSLFDPLHARKVLMDFGKAYGRLPENLSRMAPPQEAFLNEAISGLAQNGKVICVQLALFADMMKGREWTPASLVDVGGTVGVGTTFLEESFSSRTAPPLHRIHQGAARAVLSALLPSEGVDIKGHMRTADELQEASGYSSRPDSFAELMRILDSEVRLVTPIADDRSETQSQEAQSESSHRSSTPQRSNYQLTHDYLVPSLRDWLTRKQKETRRGRAELKLAERAALWDAKKENRHLPSLMEWLSICTLTKRKFWTASQQAMMKRASRVLGFQVALAIVGILVCIAARIFIRGQMLQQQQETIVTGLVNQLVSADPVRLPEIIDELESHHDLAVKHLSPLVSAKAETVIEERRQLHARLAMASHDKSLVEPLTEELLTNKYAYTGAIRQLLRPYAADLKEKFRAILRDQKVSANRRFRAALALADYIPESEASTWTPQDLQLVAKQLVAENAEFQPLLREYLRPVSGQLVSELEAIFSDTNSTDSQKLGAANAMADYAAGDIPKLSRLLTLATPPQYAVLYPIVAASPDSAAVEHLSHLTVTQPEAEMGTMQRVQFGQQRANAAVTLLRLGEREKVLGVFDMTDDPEALTQFIFRCRDRGVSISELLECLQLVRDSPADRYPPNTRYALLLALGEYTLDEIPDSRKEPVLKQLGDWYRNDPSSGVHGACGWLLRHWGQHEEVRQIDQTPVPYSADREWFTLAISVQPKPVELLSDVLTKGAAAKTFYYTFIVFPAGDSQIGSNVDEPNRGKDESRHSVTLSHSFALLDREITMGELSAFSSQYSRMMQQYDAKPEDAGLGVQWYDSVAFCRWLTLQSGLSESDQSYADPESLDVKDYPRDKQPGSAWAPSDWPLVLARGFRLPTESEWEVASRGGTRTTYGYGSDGSLLTEFGWFMENSGNHVHAPREQRPNIRGLFDMHGNLSEWTHDWYGEYGLSVMLELMNLKNGRSRVRRGGDWKSDASDCRSANRGAVIPSTRSNVNGFRLAISSPSALSQETKESQ